MRTLQSELDRIGGNVMAWLADQEAERASQMDGDQDSGPVTCNDCGARERFLWVKRKSFERKDKYYWSKMSNMTDGYCPVCLDKRA